MEFNKEGYLPEGIHTLSWDEFEDFFGFSPKRKELLDGLLQVIHILKNCGCEAIYIDGSFVTNKLEPDDWDACFKGSAESLKILKKQEPCLLLTDDHKLRETQKQKFKGELFLYSLYAGLNISYLDFFQGIKGAKKKKKGIIKINLN
ncbi:hypothetical protein [Bacteroides sp. GM023]|uniref:DUF6932 family protein n=1 Tax=Bacteroides sp. GM023 TaxID=2723058 RepID=UPI00168AC14C|nr:hypothetical protein [Bacteroides sp. GM023]MBD3590885.1 hypothetical protein [Bacteroides sp. GM023]